MTKANKTLESGTPRISKGHVPGERIACVPLFCSAAAFQGMTEATDEPVVLADAQSVGVRASQSGLAWLLHPARLETSCSFGNGRPEHLGKSTSAPAI